MMHISVKANSYTTKCRGADVRVLLHSQLHPTPSSKTRNGDGSLLRTVLRANYSSATYNSRIT